MANTVYLGPAECHPDVTEFAASEIITPGSVMVVTSGGFALAGADQAGVVYCALENILEEVTDAYAIGDTTQGARPKSGEYYELTLASAQVATKDAALTTNASGNLVLLGAGTNTVCYADEAVTTTGATGKVRVYFK
jgi:hypothetical protein